VFSGGGAVADERQLELRLRLRLREPAVGDAERLRPRRRVRLVVRGVHWVRRRPPVDAPAAVAKVAVAVHAARLPMAARQQRRHGVWRARRRRHQEGLASGGVGVRGVAAADVAGEGAAVRLVEQRVDQRVDPRRDVAHPHKHVQEVVQNRLVTRAAAQHEGHVGDEERAPHDEEEEEDDAQDLGKQKQGNKWINRQRNKEKINKEIKKK